MIRKGTYILIMELPETQVEIGSLGMLHFSKGIYCYVGSAMNGLDQRIGRHFSKEKKVRWHIDRLTILSIDMTAYESADMQECALARLVTDQGGKYVVKGFGCSDCDCTTHLFILDSEAERKLRSDARLTPHSQHHCNCL